MRCFLGASDATDRNALHHLGHTLGTTRDLPQAEIARITHFFEHYKDLEPGKWVKVLGWVGPEEAKKEILDGIACWKRARKKPRF